MKAGQEAGVKVGGVGARWDDKRNLEKWVHADNQEGVSETSQPEKAGKLGPAPRAGTQAPEVKARDQARGTRCPRAGGQGHVLTSVHEGISLDKARALIEFRISSAVPTLSKFTPGHGYLIF